MGSAGALFFFPLTPDIMCVIYDGDVYSMPSEGGWVVTHKVGDVDAFNQHQFLGCMANIYFLDWENLHAVEQAFAESLPRRPEVRHEVVTASMEHEDSGGKKYRVVGREEIGDQGETLISRKERQATTCILAVKR